MPLNICLINSIRNKSISYSAIKIIVSALESKKVNILHKHVSQMDQKKLEELTDDLNIKFHKEILRNIRLSDLVVSECSKESLSVGFLLSYAHEHEKPVVIFIKDNIPVPNLFTALSKEKGVYIVKYSEESELYDLVSGYVELASENIESRFNFYLPPSISTYLKYISKKHNKSKSAFIRDTLEEMMLNDADYLH